MKRAEQKHLVQIGFLLGRAYYAYLGLLERELQEAGLDKVCPPGIGSLLFELYETDEVSIGVLGKRLSLSKSTMTGLVRKAQACGLVTTDRDPLDGRATLVKLTALAKSIQTECDHLADRLEDSITCNLTERQKAALRKSLLLIVRSIHEGANE